MPIQSLPCDETRVCDETLPCEQGITLFATSPLAGLTLNPVLMLGGTYPGVYPGASTFPGGGSDLPATPVTPRTLTLVPA